jgi:hypothetical protein
VDRGAAFRSLRNFRKFGGVCSAIEVDTPLGGLPVQRALDRVVAERGREVCRKPSFWMMARVSRPPLKAQQASWPNHPRLN